MPMQLLKQFLEPAGWVRSKNEQTPVDGHGRALPWFTYGAIEILQQIVRPDDRVFEFGAGQSTLWWQTKAAVVDSVEHDRDWCARLRPSLSSNVTLAEIAIDAPCDPDARDRAEPFFVRERRVEWPYDADRIVRRGLEDERFIAYATHIDRTANAGGPYDFIIVDGMARRLCAFVARDHLKQDGFLILDNSNRGDYDLAYTMLDEAGFRQIPCWGLVPGANFMTNTSLFTRSLGRLPSARFAGNSFGLPEY